MTLIEFEASLREPIPPATGSLDDEWRTIVETLLTG
jgi:hypothetical protein